MSLENREKKIKCSIAEVTPFSNKILHIEIKRVKTNHLYIYSNDKIHKNSVYYLVYPERWVHFW